MICIKMASALKTKAKEARPVLSKSRSDSSLRKKSPKAVISSFGRPKSASKAKEDRPKSRLTKEKENRSPRENLRTSKRKSHEEKSEEENPFVDGPKRHVFERFLILSNF